MPPAGGSLSSRGGAPRPFEDKEFCEALNEMLGASRYPVRLIATDGPAAGVNVLIDAEMSLGRDPSNQIVVGDSALSRRHCLLRPAEGGVEVEDLGSANGTFVNGELVTKRILAHHDLVTVGESTFVVALDGVDEDRSAQVDLEDRTVVVGHTIRSRGADPEGRDAQDLAAVLRVAQAASSASTSAALQDAVAERLLETLPADRCAIVLLDATTGELRTGLLRDRRGGRRAATISRSVVRQALDENAGILVSAEGPPESVVGRSDSFRSSGARAVICAPLRLPRQTIGAVYVDSQQLNVFEERHLQIVTLAASIVGGALAQMLAAEWLEQQKSLLEADVEGGRNMVGDSDQLRNVHKFVKRVAPTDSTVLIMGESGTGKELIARAIHQHSARSAAPFVAINCAVLGETLIESELFGHERGAFTGAIAQKRGKLEMAEGGTLFLDEVGELAPPLQAKLLRVLQEREFERVGGTRVLKANVRVIAATNRDLLQASKTGTFRSDLYYRLNVLTIVLPPLRERTEDIPLLVAHFAAKCARKCKRRVAGATPEAIGCLMRYPWPGNVRELENIVERAAVIGTSDLIQPEDLPEEIVEYHPAAGAVGGASPLPFHEGVRAAKQQLIVQAVAAARGKYTEAARRLGLHPNYLHMLIRNLGLKDTLKK